MNTFRRNDGVTKDPVSKENPDCTGSIQLWDIIQVFFFFSLPTYITVIPNTCVHRPLVVSMLTIRGIGYIKGTSGAVHAQLSRRDVYVRVLSGPLTWSKSLKKAWLFHIVQRLQRHFFVFLPVQASIFPELLSCLYYRPFIRFSCRSGYWCH